jgi:hypothetical protein
MTPLSVQIKHAGKVYDVHLDTDQPPSAFKQEVYQVTGVPVDRMKVMIKGGVLKVRRKNDHRTIQLTFNEQDDTDWAKVAPKSVSGITPSSKPLVQSSLFLCIGSDIHSNWSSRRVAQASGETNRFP